MQSDNDESSKGDQSRFEQGVSSANGLLARAFSSCDSDPKGSVHRAWGISLIFIVIYFIMAVIEMINLNNTGGSKAVVVATIWTALIHLILAILGTFVLKRFPTNFSVGFFLGVLVVLVNQNLILFTSFHTYSFGTARTNHTFANLAFCICLVLGFFTLLLINFRMDVVVAPIDAKGMGGARSSRRGEASEEGASYQSYEESRI